MQQQSPIEPNVEALPEVYGTMPNKWEKWTRTDKKRERRNILKWVGFQTLEETTRYQVFGPKLGQN